jgi:hypothetical protein
MSVLELDRGSSDLRSVLDHPCSAIYKVVWTKRCDRPGLRWEAVMVYRLAEWFGDLAEVQVMGVNLGKR